jgi:hypothetical protein
LGTHPDAKLCLAKFRRKIFLCYEKIMPRQSLGRKYPSPSQSLGTRREGRQELGNEPELSSPGRRHGAFALFIIKADG